MYTHKVDNLDEIDKFLERQKLVNLTLEEIHNLNISVHIKETVFTIKNITKNKNPGADNFAGVFY